MRAIQLSETQRTIWRLVSLLCFWYGFVSCDILEPDADVITPSTKVTDKEVVVLADGPSFIDLNSRVQTNVPARAALTTQPRYGKITDLGKGILQYTPAVGNNKGRDDFEFTLYTTGNEIIERDTIVIVIENDSTKLPCNIYPRADYVYAAGLDSVSIDVTINDIICGGPVNLSIFQPDNTFPPEFGTAKTFGNKIKYTRGPSFSTGDKIIYKLTAAYDTTRHAYGVVYITADSACNFRLKDDYFTFNEYALDSLITLPVFQNDSLCHAISQYQVNVKSPPIHGQVFPVPDGFRYNVPASATLPLDDYFTYEFCKDAICKTARVTVTIKRDSVILCQLLAREDTIDISGNNIPLMYMGVLANDSICGELKSLEILKPPAYGVSAVAGNEISYQRDPEQEKDDHLEYEICNSQGCSRTTVFIKRTK